MKKTFIFLPLLTFYFDVFSSGVDPLSKIIIKSKSLKFCKDQISNASLIQYKDSVNVLLADDTKINSDFLEITMDRSLMFGKNKNDQEKADLDEAKGKESKIKKIFFDGNVNIESNNKTAKASKAELLLDEKKVILKDDVEIIQKKEKPKDLPITIKSSEVVLDLTNEDVQIAGSDQSPIETTIELAGYPGLLKKIKTKEEKAQLRREKRRQKLEAKKNQ